MNPTTRPHFLLLFLLISFGSVSAVLFTPALPDISQYFAVDANQAGLTITLFLVGYAFGQLLYGPIANAYGRKIALYIGISLEIFAAILCVISALVHAFWLLVLARLIMALGASVGLKMSFTLVADSYDQSHAAKVISHLMIAFAITPAIGVAIGGYLTEHFNWQACFYFMAAYGVLLLALTIKMSETAKALDKTALLPSKIWHKYTAMLSNIQLVSGAALMGCATAIVYVFAALAPFIAMSLMHLSPGEYGLWNLLPSVGIIIGSQLSARCANKLSAMQAVMLGLGLIILGVALMFMAFVMNKLIAECLFIPMAIAYIGMSFIFANASGLAMASSEDKPNASAMMNFINMSVATISVLIVGFIQQTSLTLPLVYGMMIVVALLLVGILQRQLSRG